MVGYKGRLFTIYKNYQVGESRTSYTAAGCGMYLALGSLHTTQQYIWRATPEERIRLALFASAFHNTDVVKPFVIKSI